MAREKTNFGDLYAQYIEKRVSIREKGYALEKTMSRAEFVEEILSWKDKYPDKAMTTLADKVASNQRVLSPKEYREIIKNEEFGRTFAEIFNKSDMSRKELYDKFASMGLKDDKWKEVFWRKTNESQYRYFY